jgi:Flagellar basal body-associated protein FliL
MRFTTLAGVRVAVRHFGWGIVMLAAWGCSSQPLLDFDALGLAPAQEKLTEIPLGRYTVPIPVTIEQADEGPHRCNRFQFDFELYALVAPQQSGQIEDARQRHEGQLRDRVMRVCRNTSVEELQEPQLATLRARLTDAVQNQLGQSEIRQVLITDVTSQEI